jgi:hypothetical protein
MSSGKQKNGADARAKKAALLFLACERNPDPTGRLSIPNVLRVKGYSEDKAVNHMLQMQVRREVEKLERQFIRLSSSSRNDHVIHDDDDHNNEDHGNNDQFDLVRGAGPSVPTEENAQNEPPASPLLNARASLGVPSQESVFRSTISFQYWRR